MEIKQDYRWIQSSVWVESADATKDGKEVIINYLLGALNRRGTEACAHPQLLIIEYSHLRYWQCSFTSETAMIAVNLFLTTKG
jgi:hypothetical protein